MKTTILIWFIGFSAICQIKQTETDFYLENQKIYWEHVYDTPGKNKDELVKYFEKEVLTNTNLGNFQFIDNTISFKITDDKADYKKYGGTTMGTVMFAQYNLSYLVLINFKNNKYRVIVKDVFLDNKINPYRSSGELVEYISKKRNTEFTTNSLAIKGIIYFHKHFLEKFQISSNNYKSDW